MAADSATSASARAREQRHPFSVQKPGSSGRDGVRRLTRHREEIRNTIQAPLTQQRGGKTLYFKSWSDGGQPVHTVRPQANVTYSASYKQR